MTSERDLIRHLAARFPKAAPVQIGIGDDGAVLDCRHADQQTVVTDMLLDQVHFDLRQTSAECVGRKAVAVNLSDLAAMACRPTAAFISLAVPRDLPDTDRFLQQVYDGIEKLARQYNFCVAGGDTNAWDGPFAINVCLTGVPMADRPVLRSTAVPGDVLLVSGPLGGSLKSGRHLTFEPRLELAEWLMQHTQLQALMDLSDGLALDLLRMMEASGTGAVIHASQIPVHSDVSANLSAADRLQHALSDGEDFELLLAVPASEVDALIQHTDLPGGCRLHPIGTVAATGQCQLADSAGNLTPLRETGWQHL